MSASELTGILGTGNSLPGRVQPGAGQLVTPANPVGLQQQDVPILGHCYTNTGTFKQILSLLDRPKFQDTINSAGQPVTVLMQSLSGAPSGPAPTWGDVVRITQQATDTTPLYAGIIEDLEIDYGPTTRYALALQPLGSELGDTFFSVGYNYPTDPAQMVRDAVETTRHLWVTPQSCPDTGQLGIYNFSNTTCLEVMHVAKLIAGVTWWWFVDPAGCVWFRPFNASAPATYTVKQGDFTAEKFREPISKLKNQVVAVGGIPYGGSAPRVSVYSDATSQAQYGMRAQMPPLNFPTVTDQATLDAVTLTVGQGLNRRSIRIELTLTDYPQRIVIGQQMPSIRYWEPSSYPMVEGVTGVGGYSATFLVLDVQNEGPTQVVTLGDTPPSSVDDYKYQIAQIVSRISLADLTYVPASLNVMGTVNGGGMQTAGAGSARWVIDSNSIRAEDGTANDYGAGPGVTVRLGSSGAAFLGGGTGVAHMRLDGTVPIEQIVDASGIIRAELGSLGANGISPAQYGLRANDAGGNPIFDSMGLIGVMRVLGQHSMDGTWAFGNTMATINFTLARQATVWFVGQGVGTSAAGGAGDDCLYLGGTLFGNSSMQASAIGSSFFFIPVPTSLAAGSYSLTAVNALGGTTTVSKSNLMVFLLGS